MKKHNFLFRFLLAIFVFFNKRILSSALLFLFFFILAIIGFKKLEIDFSSLAIFSSDSIDTVQLKAIEKNYYNSYPIFVLLENNSFQESTKKSAQNSSKKNSSEIDRQKLIQQLEKIASRLKTNSFIDKVIIQKSDVIWLEKLLLLANDDQYKQIEDLFQENSLHFFLKSINSRMENFAEGEVDNKEMIKQLKSIKNILNGLIENRSKQFFQQEYKNLLLNDNYFIDASGKYAYLTIVPNFAISDSQQCIKNVAEIEKQISAIISDEMNFSLTGIPVRTRDEISNGQKTLNSASVFLILFLIIFLYIAFRIKSAPIVLLSTIGMGIFLTLGLIGFVWGKISNIELLILIALLGIAIDFSIHYINAFIYLNINLGYDFQKSIITTTNKVGGSVLATIFTTIIGFLILCFSSLEVLNKIGVISSIGLAIQVFTLFLFLPICLKIRELCIKEQQQNNSLMVGKKINNFFFRINVLQKKTGFVIFVFTILFTGFVTFFAFKIKKINNPMKVYNKEIKSVKTQDKMNTLFNLSPDVMFVNTSSMEETRQLHDKIEKLPTVKQVHSIVNLLPTKKNQQQRMLKIKQFNKKVKGQKSWKAKEKELLNHLENFNGNLMELMELLSFTGDNETAITQIEKIFLMNEETNFNTRFKNALLDNKEKIEKKFYTSSVDFIFAFLNSSKEIITKKKISKKLKKNLISFDGKNFLITIYPKYDPWPQVFRKNFIQSVKSVSEKATGFVVLGDKLINVVDKEAVILISLSFIFIFIFLTILLKNLIFSIITILPLLLSTVTVIGLMGILKIEFDFINILIILILIGIGTDYSLHISEAYIKEEKDLAHVVQQVGNGIFLSSITSIIGFSAIIFSNISSIKYTGIFVCCGIFFCYLFTMNTQVFLLHVFRRKLKFYKKSSHGNYSQ